MLSTNNSIGLSLSEIPATQILNAIFCGPKTPLPTTNRRRFGIFYKLSGISEMQNDAGSWIFDQDHVVIIPKGCTYTIYPRKLGQTIMIEFDCAPDFTYDASCAYSFRISNPSLIARLFTEAEHAWTFKKTAFRNRCLSSLYTIFAELERDNVRSYIDSHLQNAVRQAQNYLEAHFSDPELDVTVLAEVAGLSLSYFRRLFTEIYRLPPGQYISLIRMEKAKDLLSSGSCSVGEVAEMVGYSNIYYFSGAFRKAVGVSPSEFARQMN